MRGRARWALVLFLAALISTCGEDPGLPDDVVKTLDDALDPRNPDPLIPAPVFEEKRPARDLLYRSAAMDAPPPEVKNDWHRQDLLKDEVLARLRTRASWSPAVVATADGAPELLFRRVAFLPMGMALPVGRIHRGFRLLVRCRMLEATEWNAGITFEFRQGEVGDGPDPASGIGNAVLRFQLALGGGGDGRLGGYTHGSNIQWGKDQVSATVLEARGWLPGRSYLWDLTVDWDEEGWFVRGGMRDLLDGAPILWAKRYAVPDSTAPRDAPWTLFIFRKLGEPSIDMVVDGLWLDTKEPLGPPEAPTSPDTHEARHGRWSRGVFLPEDDTLMTSKQEPSIEDLGSLLWARLQFDGSPSKVLPVARRFFQVLVKALGEARDETRERLLAWVPQMIPLLRRRVLESEGWKDDALARSLETLAETMPAAKVGDRVDAYDLEDLARLLRPAKARSEDRETGH